MKVDSVSHLLPQGKLVAGLPRLAKRQNAEHYLLLLLVGFAGSIIATRTFLELTGYPQIASGDFHIAHVLWGGLLLFAAALLLLIWRAPRLYWLGSLLTGVGFGLFIDEVGKFITKTNDYFYPLAAPIIYAFFLLTVFIYTRVRSLRTAGPNVEIYALLEGLERGMDPHLPHQEYREIKLRLSQIAAHSADANVVGMATNALDFLEAENFERSLTKPIFIDRWRTRLAAAEARWITQTRLRITLIFGFILLGMRGLLTGIAIILLVPEISDPAGWQQLASTPAAEGGLFGGTRLLLAIAGLALESFIGGLLLAAAIFLIARQPRRGLEFGYWGLLIGLVAVQWLMSYFNQFDVIVTNLLQLGLLLGILRYRARHISS